MNNLSVSGAGLPRTGLATRAVLGPGHGSCSVVTWKRGNSSAGHCQAEADRREGEGLSTHRAGFGNSGEVQIWGVDLRESW